MGGSVMAQILLTGATGFVGDALLPALVNDEHSLVCLTRNRTKAAKRFTALAASIRWITSVTEVEVMPNAVIRVGLRHGNVCFVRLALL